MSAHPPLALAELAATDERLERACRGPALHGPDLVALVRSASIRKGYRSVMVPTGAGSPDLGDWTAASFTVEDGTVDNKTAGVRIVTPRPWKPSWTDDATLPDVAAATGEVRQPPQAVAGDPFLQAASGGRRTYRTPGQQAAVRAVLAAQGDETVIAVLPTGSGKTLVATAPAFLAQPDVTVLVVPTVSLALDLERRIADDYDITAPVAYHGGLSPEAKQGMRHRLRDRSQWIVVTSPEAATASLATTLEELAVGGRLRHFVIDEAHIVSAWGGAFRPAFQGLAGLRRRLREAAAAAGTSFTTLLLTGTLDQHGYHLLRQFFSEGEPTVVLAQATRPEPAFWSVPTGGDDQKRAAVIDASRHLPRPAIVYTSLVTGRMAPNAADVHGWLATAGFGRLALVTGDSTVTTRRAVVAKVRCEGDPTEDVDVVVATSAFGLGVDIEHVRSVVHVCVPESIDRYYQEVGRGGRDGRASVSLVIHAPNDVPVAERLASPGSIGSEKAWLRWQAMHRGATVRPDRLVVSLRAAHEGITVAAGSLNEDWNLHTLTMMELAGMVRLHWTPASQLPDTADDEALLAYFDHLYQQVEVEVMEGNLQDGQAFRLRFEAVGAAGRDAATVGLERTRAVIAGPGRCHNAVFVEAYRVTMPNHDVVTPERRCGGCPDCRRRRLPPWTGDGPVVEPYVRPRPCAAPVRLEPLLGRDGIGSVTYVSALDAGDDELEVLLRRLVGAGSHFLVSPPAIERLVSRLEEMPGSWLAREPLSRWLDREQPVPVATTLVLPPGVGPGVIERVLRHADEVPGLVVIHHAGQAGAPATKLYLREQVRPSTDLASALRRI